MKKTRITIREDQYKSVTSTWSGHNSDTMAFNIGLVGREYPKLAHKLFKIYEKLPILKEEENEQSTNR